MGDRNYSTVLKKHYINIETSSKPYSNYQGFIIWNQFITMDTKNAQIVQKFWYCMYRGCSKRRGVLQETVGPWVVPCTIMQTPCCMVLGGNYNLKRIK
jgi:hypothetical protein